MRTFLRELARDLICDNFSVLNFAKLIEIFLSEYAHN